MCARLRPSGLLSSSDLNDLRGVIRRHRPLIRTVCEVPADPGKRGCWCRCDTCGAFNHVEGTVLVTLRCMGCTGALTTPVAIQHYRHVADKVAVLSRLVELEPELEGDLVVVVKKEVDPLKCVRGC